MLQGDNLLKSLSLPAFKSVWKVSITSNYFDTYEQKGNKTISEHSNLIEKDNRVINAIDKSLATI